MKHCCAKIFVILFVLPMLLYVILSYQSRQTEKECFQMFLNLVGNIFANVSRRREKRKHLSKHWKSRILIPRQCFLRLAKAWVIAKYSICFFIAWIECIFIYSPFCWILGGFFTVKTVFWNNSQWIEVI
jgi:hypothetical protein